MSKKPRRTMADVTSGLRDQAQAPAPAQTTLELVLERAATRSRENVTSDKPKGFNVRKERIEKPHQSVYAHPVVFRELRKIAASEDLKPQDLYREGLREVFRRRGLDFDKLDQGQEV